MEVNKVVKFFEQKKELLLQLLRFTGEETCPIVGKLPVCLLRERLHRLAPPSMVAYLASSAAVPESRGLAGQTFEFRSNVVVCCLLLNSILKKKELLLQLLVYTGEET